MQRHILIVIAALALSTVAFSQTPVVDSAHPDAFQIRYVGNLSSDTNAMGSSSLAGQIDTSSVVINITNSGTSATTANPKVPMCVNVYAFDAGEELLACCTCQVTPNGLAHISVVNDVLGHLLTPGTPNEFVIKLLATSTTLTTCDAGNSYTPAQLVSGLRAWGTTLHFAPGTSPTSGAKATVVTEGAFLDGGLSAAELTHITTFCGFIEANGSGHGVCNTNCNPPLGNGALPGAKQ